MVEHRIRKTHRRGTGMDAFGDAVSAEGEVGCTVQRVVGRHIVARHLLLGAVVVHRARMTGDGHNSHVRFHRLVTVRHVEGHRVEVGVLVGELSGGETHVGGTHIGALSGNLSVGHHSIVCRREDEVVAGVQVRTVSGVEAADTVLLTIEHIAVVMTGDGHNCVNRRNLLVTIDHLEINVGEVGARIGKVIGLETHVCLTVHILAFHHVGTGCDGRAVELEVVGGVERIADLHHIVTAHVVRDSVVGVRCRVTGNRHHHIVNRRDGLIAVRHGEGHPHEVRVRVMEHRVHETHVGLAVHIRTFHHVRAGGRAVAAEPEVVLHIVQRGIRRGRVARHGV